MASRFASRSHALNLRSGAEVPLPGLLPLGDFVGEDAAGFGVLLDGADSYRMVEWARLLKSNSLTEPSEPTEAKLSTELAVKVTSNTSLSWAINCVLA